MFGGSRSWAETANRIVAVVNDEVITEADVTSRVNALLDGSSDAASLGSDPSTMHQAILQRLIDHQLLLQEAKRLNVSVTMSEVDQRLDAIRGRLGSEDAFRQALASSALSEEQLKDEIRNQLLIDRLIDQKIRSTVGVSPQEVAQAIGEEPGLAKPGDRVRAAHLLVRVNERRSEDQARALITDLHRQLSQGADFEAIARQYSEDAHATAGGLMEWVAPGELLPELDAALFSLKEGELSQPIQTRLGFHIVKVLERRAATSLSLLEAHRTVSQRLYEQKFQAAMQRWLVELRRRAYIHLVGSNEP